MLSILSTKVDYVDYNRKILPTNVMKMNPTEGRCQKGYSSCKVKAEQVKRVIFDDIKEQFYPNYLGRYEGVQAEIHQVSQFDESSVITAYLAKVEMSIEGDLRAQEQISTTDQSTTITDFKILLDSGASENVMSKQCYLRNKSPHGLPKFSSKAKVIQVGNGASDNILLSSPLS